MQATIRVICVKRPATAHALTVGDRLGHYDVAALIGEGGMGQVYRATDTLILVAATGCHPGRPPEAVALDQGRHDHIWAGDPGPQIFKLDHYPPLTPQLRSCFYRTAVAG